MEDKQVITSRIMNGGILVGAFVLLASAFYFFA